MKKILLLALSFAVLPLSAQEDGKELTPVEQLLKIMKIQENVIESGEAGFSMVEESLVDQNLTKEEMAEVKAAFTDYLQKLASDPVFKTKTRELYENNFTNDEIIEMIAFYKTPLGQKTLHVLPKITGEAVNFSMEIAQKHVGSFQDALTKILERKAAKEE